MSPPVSVDKILLFVTLVSSDSTRIKKQSWDKNTAAVCPNLSDIV
jgi:hypothetical protein